MTKKKMLHFAMYVCKPWKVRYGYSLERWCLHHKSVSKLEEGFIYRKEHSWSIWKTQPGWHKSAIVRQITLASKSYGKIPKMASKSSASHQKGNREILMKILESVRFLGKIYLTCFRMKLSIAFTQCLIQIFSDDSGKFEILEYQKTRF